MKKRISIIIFVVIIITGFTTCTAQKNPRFTSVFTDSLRNETGRIYVTDNKGSVVSFISRNDSLFAVDVSGEYHINTGLPSWATGSVKKSGSLVADRFSVAATDSSIKTTRLKYKDVHGTLSGYLYHTPLSNQWTEDTLGWDGVFGAYQLYDGANASTATRVLTTLNFSLFSLSKVGNTYTVSPFSAKQSIPSVYTGTQNPTLTTRYNFDLWGYFTYLNSIGEITCPTILLNSGTGYNTVKFGGTAGISGSGSNLYLGNPSGNGQVTINDIMRMNPRSSDPSTLSTGMFWYRSDLNQYSGFDGSSVIRFGTGSSGGTGVGDNLGLPPSLSTKMYEASYASVDNPQGAFYVPMIETGTDNTPYDTTITISSANIIAGTNIDLIPAKGAKTVIVPTKVVIYYDYTTSAYTSSDANFSALIINGTTNIYAINDEMLEGSADIYRQSSNQTGNVILETSTFGDLSSNTKIHLDLYPHTGATAAGTAKLKVWYYIADFN